MSNLDTGISEITKIGNYAIPAFAAFITASFCLGNFQSTPQGQAVVLNLALYTLASACVAYAHRLSYLRYKKRKELNGEKSTHLPRSVVIIFMLLHLSFFLILSYRLWPLAIIEKDTANKKKQAVSAQVQTQNTAKIISEKIYNSRYIQKTS